MPTLNYNPKSEIPSLTGKIILITGGTAGLGYETAISFAAHNPAHLFFTGRSQSSADRLIKEVNAKHPGTPITFIQCDLASLDSVRIAAKQFLSDSSRLDIMIANAGVMALPPGQTKDGYEIQFGTNHMGHALLVKILTPLMEATANDSHDVRIVWLTSQGYRNHPAGGIVFDKVKTPQSDISLIAGSWVRYGQAKLANVLYARAFAIHHPSITSVAVHPGVSVTGLVTSLGFFSRMLIYITCIGKMLSPEQCAWNQQWAATGPLGTGDKHVESGKYYDPVGVKGKLHRESGNAELGEKLWEWTQKELKEYS